MGARLLAPSHTPVLNRLNCEMNRWKGLFVVSNLVDWPKRCLLMNNSIECSTACCYGFGVQLTTPFGVNPGKELCFTEQNNKKPRFPNKKQKAKEWPNQSPSAVPTTVTTPRPPRSPMSSPICSHLHLQMEVAHVKIKCFIRI